MQVDQAHLETVLPSPGGKVVTLKGSHTGERATLMSINVDKYQAEIKFKNGDVRWVEYEDISKHVS